VSVAKFCIAKLNIILLFEIQGMSLDS